MSGAKRSWFAPEVIQTSTVDCGPASLKCLLEGFGIPVSYGRLREACQTEVDGTSINTLEEVATRLGLEAAQTMVPYDHLLLPEANLLPALVVLQKPDRFTHFVVVWRRAGDRVQVMDPARGRYWTTVERLIAELFLYELPFPAASWRESAGTATMLDPLRRRLRDLGIAAEAEAALETALSDPGWRPLATIDAAARLTAELVRSGAIARGQEAFALFTSLLVAGVQRGEQAYAAIPERFWSAREAPPDEDGEEQLYLRGAVLLSVQGPREEADEDTLPVELAAALTEPPSRPGRELWSLLFADGALTPAAVLVAMAMAACGVIFEAVLFRSLLDLGTRLGIAEQRLLGLGALMLFLAGTTVLQASIGGAITRLGRRLEVRRRLALFEKLPRLDDRYFRSRPSSDSAERGHSVHHLRSAPVLAQGFVEASMGLLATTFAIAWLDVRSGLVALVCTALAFLLPTLFGRTLIERDLRMRIHLGALSRHYLDGMLGLIAVRTHGAERSVQREHESLLVEWARSSHALVRAVVSVTGVQAIFGFGVAAAVVMTSLASTSEVGSVLLAAYWALLLPVYGEDLAEIFWRYPEQRNITLRQIELTRALEEGATQEAAPSPESSPAPATSGGVAIRFDAVSVRAAGHTVLERIDLSIAPGEHLAIVGVSGAGKSSLLGLLLGWHRPSEGHITVDGEELDVKKLESLRAQTSWLDPAVQLWNRSLLENLFYGSEGDKSGALGETLRDADLLGVLERLPQGLDTRLGEGGGLVSGGEGQRVRLGRALMRPNARLALFDEPFRGLDRDKRTHLLERAREHYRSATLLVVTHDVSHALELDRVLVIEGGRIVEDGDPRALAADESTAFRRMLDAETNVRAGLWNGPGWRRFELENGKLIEYSGPPEDEALTSPFLAPSGSPGGPES